MDDLVRLAVDELRESDYAIALTGAGISTESCIPDYRGPEGIWTKNPEAERRAYESFRVFTSDPARYWKEGYGHHALHDLFLKAVPNKGHMAIRSMEEHKLLKMTITQNIDNLHAKAGTKKLIEYHGNALKLRCIDCNSRYPIEEYNAPIPICGKCGKILKSDVVNFGEPIPPDVMNKSYEEVKKCDLMLICGTSALVHPFASLPYLYKDIKGDKAKIIEINIAPTPITKEGLTDIFILGKTGIVLPKINDIIKKYI